MERMTFVEYAEQREAKNLRLIDVREQDEYDAVHVTEAELLPLSLIRKGERPEDDGRQLALICRSGGRSAMAAQMLEQDGFADIINVEGGTLAAIEAGEDHLSRG